MELLCERIILFSFPRPDSRPHISHINPAFFHAFEPHRKKFWFHHPSNLCAYKSAAIILNDFIAPGSDNSIKSFCGALVFCLSPSHWWNNLLGAAANGKLGQIGGADWQQRPAC
jgi:hypothetical protein